MAHIRYATSGGVSLANVHPFNRELWGIHYSFAHNGQVPKFDDSTRQIDQPLLGKTLEKDIHYHPVGDTDSEAVFCAILNALKAEFDTLPTLPILHGFLSQICQEIIQGEEDSTIFNFLLGCGQYTMFAYSWPGRRPGSQVWNGLYYIVRAPPFSTAQLVDVDYAIDFAQHTTPSDRVAVITTQPLTSEKGWKEFKKGQLLMFDKGLPYQTPNGCELVEREGRGLYSKCYPRSKCSSSSSSSSATNDLLSSSPPSSAILSPCSSSLSLTMDADADATGSTTLSSSPPSSAILSSSTCSSSSSRQQQQQQQSLLVSPPSPKSALEPPTSRVASRG
jgi:predicted glutamine amidotransferase